MFGVSRQQAEVLGSRVATADRHRCRMHVPELEQILPVRAKPISLTTSKQSMKTQSTSLHVISNGHCIVIISGSTVFICMRRSCSNAAHALLGGQKRPFWDLELTMQVGFPLQHAQIEDH